MGGMKTAVFLERNAHTAKFVVDKRAKSFLGQFRGRTEENC